MRSDRCWCRATDRLQDDVAVVVGTGVAYRAIKIYIVHVVYPGHHGGGCGTTDPLKDGIAIIARPRVPYHAITGNIARP